MSRINCKKLSYRALNPEERQRLYRDIYGNIGYKIYY